MNEKPEDPAMLKVRAIFEKSGLTLNELGLKMGCPPDTARQSAFQFMKTKDPQIGMLRRFAAAMGLTVEELVGEKRKKQTT
jgi:transcriptional regulator with XRE-family HTH domain